MKRVMIIGCCGAGKSTFSRKLHAILELPLIHLDQHYWNANWVETPQAEWMPKVEALANRDTWIIDGNYSGSMDLRIARADTVFYLDYPIRKCLWRVIKRISKYHGQRRPDMPLGCNERFDLDFLHYVATFNIVKRKSILARLALAADHADIVVIKSDQEIALYLTQLKTSSQSIG